MFGFGTPELIIILLIVVIIFGGSKLPELGGALGKSIRNFKNSSEDKDAIEVNSDRKGDPGKG